MAIRLERRLSFSHSLYFLIKTAYAAMPGLFFDAACAQRLNLAKRAIFIGRLN
jgi:hypothetical protein